MKKILAIIRKDVILRFSSKTELLYFIILPLFFTFLLAGGTTAGTADTRLGLAVVDLANSTLSADLLAELDKSTTVVPIPYELSEAEQLFNERRMSSLLILPAGFTLESLEAGEAMVELRQQPNNLNALAAERAVQTALQRLSSAVQIATTSVQAAEDRLPFDSENARQDYFGAALLKAKELMQTAPQRMQVIRGGTPDQVEYDPAANSSAGQLITWVFIPLVGVSGLFAFERQQGTLRRLLTTPTQRVTYLLGTISGQVLVAIVQMILLVGFGILVMRVKWGQDLAGLAVLMVSFALAAASLGTALGAFVKTEGQASGLSLMLGMVMALLGGCWYPLELFPDFVRTAVKVLPTTWAMQGMLDLVLRGQGLSAILPEAGVLLGFAAVFLVIGVARFRYE
ncbi:MAG: ABC transporter permease [Anaerolineales bacterium]|jgi:ABC-2 type transport system permease protein|nr:ABC transporter permease [Anaerolineales bacterium]